MNQASDESIEAANFSRRSVGRRLNGVPTLLVYRREHQHGEIYGS